ncbi:CesT family type III secretion system chaperone [Noviherbaspirillum saxi]|nr:CesT family type III secretion system chaperone [Noviherbaspirillum saxi]
MDQKKDFHNLMASLWRYMDVALPLGQCNEVYTVTFDNQVEVHFLNTLPGRLDMIAEAGILNNKQAAQPLLDLLELNHPPYNVNVDQDTGAVMVWTRQELATLDCSQLIEIISVLMARVQQAKLCIEYRHAQSVLSPAPNHHRMILIKERKKHTDTGLRN